MQESPQNILNSSLDSGDNSGFTLIELLVVIAIIGILSSVVLAALSGARSSARDTKRVQDFRQLRTAINMYQNDHGGNYPGIGDTDHQISKNCSEIQLYQDLVGGGYISEMPTDPAENTVSCDNADQASGSDFMYGWDYSNGGGDMCIVINNFESSDSGGSLSNVNQVSEGGWGPQANASQAEFVYCFEEADYN